MRRLRPSGAADKEMDGRESIQRAQGTARTRTVPRLTSRSRRRPVTCTDTDVVDGMTELDLYWWRALRHSGRPTRHTSTAAAVMIHALHQKNVFSGDDTKSWRLQLAAAVRGQRPGTRTGGAGAKTRSGSADVRPEVVTTTMHRHSAPAIANSRPAWLTARSDRADGGLRAEAAACPEVMVTMWRIIRLRKTTRSAGARAPVGPVRR